MDMCGTRCICIIVHHLAKMLVHSFVSAICSLNDGNYISNVLTVDHKVGGHFATKTFYHVKFRKRTQAKFIA